MKEKGKERRKSSPEKKKERWKSENGSLLKQIGTLCLFVCVGVRTAVFAVFPVRSNEAHWLNICLCVCLCVHMKAPAGKKVSTFIALMHQ